MKHQIPENDNRALPEHISWRDAAVLAALLLSVFLANLHWHHTHALRLIDDPIGSVEQVVHVVDDPLTAFKDMAFFTDSMPVMSVNVFVAGIIQKIVGPSGLAFVMTGTFFYLLAVGAIFLAARRKTGLGGAFIAGVAVACIPAVFVWSRVFIMSSSTTLMAAPAVGLCLAVWSEHFSRPVLSLLFLVVAILSMRVGIFVSNNFQSVLLYAILVGYELVVGFTSKDGKNLRRVGWIFAAVIFAVLVIQTSFFQNSMNYLRHEGIELSDDQYSSSRLLSHPDSLAAYPVYMWHLALKPFFCLATLAASLFLLKGGKWRDQVFLVVFWGVLIILSLVSKKNYNYVFSVLPITGAIIGRACDKLDNKKAVWAIAGLMTLIGAGHFWHYSHGSQPMKDKVPEWSMKYFDNYQYRPIASIATKIDGREELARRIVSLAAKHDELDVVFWSAGFDESARTTIGLLSIFDSRQKKVRCYFPDIPLQKTKVIPADAVADVIVHFPWPDQAEKFQVSCDAVDRQDWISFCERVHWDDYEKETMEIRHYASIVIWTSKKLLDRP